MSTATAERNVVGKAGRPAKPKPEDPLDALASTKVRRRIIKWGKHVAEHRGIDLYEYFDSILMPVVERDYHQTGREIVRESRPRKPKHD